MLHPEPGSSMAAVYGSLYLAIINLAAFLAFAIDKIAPIPTAAIAMDCPPYPCTSPSSQVNKDWNSVPVVAASAWVAASAKHVANAKVLACFLFRMLFKWPP